MRVCGVDEDTVSDMEGWREKIRIDSGIKVKKP